MWSTAADSLLKWLSKQGVFAQGYADDEAVLVCGKFMNTVCDVMQRVLHGSRDGAMIRCYQSILIRLK